MRLLAFLHSYGVNTALLAGLVLMPAVIAVGYMKDDASDRAVAGLTLRGTLDADSPTPSAAQAATLPANARLSR